MILLRPCHKHLYFYVTHFKIKRMAAAASNRKMTITVILTAITAVEPAAAGRGPPLLLSGVVSAMK